ncbi:MAG: hypothetical protein WDA70_12250 [Lysobacteraceae bacterium]
MSIAPADPYLMLTPAGALLAFADRTPDTTSARLQTLVPRGSALRRSVWLGEDAERQALLEEGLKRGWLHEIGRELQAPDVVLDDYLPHAIAGLSGSRMAALASDDGFCLARVGYAQDEADTLSVAAADFLDFVNRQKQRGYKGTGRAVSFHESIDMLMPATTFTLFWVDGVGYWLILGGEPLLNNRALVELIWGIRMAGERFRPG